MTKQEILNRAAEIKEQADADKLLPESGKSSMMIELTYQRVLEAPIAYRLNSLEAAMYAWEKQKATSVKMHKSGQHESWKARTCPLCHAE